MERRQIPRQQTALAATLTVLSEPPVSMEVSVEDLSGAGVRVRLKGPVQAGAVVQIALEDALYLGEIMYCSQFGEGVYAGLALRHSLTHVKDLASLMRRLVPESHPIAPVAP